MKGLLWVIVILSTVAVMQVVSTCCQANTISISGNGKVQLKPDLATIVVGVQQKGATTAAALSALNVKINAVLAIIKKFNIPAADYSTQNFNIFPDYTYENGQSKVIGQIATESITVIIRGFSSDGALIGSFIDAVSVINGITISGVTFDRSDKDAAITQARGQAFKDAKLKATQFATLGGTTLKKILSISDQNSGSYTPFFASLGNAVADTKTVVPVSNVIASASVTVVWALSF